MHMEELLKELLNNSFDPTTDLPVKLPDAAGAYLISAKSIDVLPTSMKELKYKTVNGLPVIYVGIAGRPTSKVKSLRKRDYKTHFNGTARRSTLRKSLGVLFKFEKEFENQKSNSKYKFSGLQEAQLTKWMQENLTMNFVRISNPMEFEKFMIMAYEPPLNIQDNHSETNREFRRELKRLRVLR